MQDINIVLNGCISGLDIKPVSPGQSISPCPTEKPTLADHRHLPDLREDGVPAQYTEGATIILAGRNDEVQGHKQAKIILEC